MEALNGWEIVEPRGVAVARSLAFAAALPNLGHAFSTRRDASGRDFDLGGPDDTGPEFEERRRRLASAAGLGRGAVTVLRQVHGAAVVRAARFREGDAGDAVVGSRGDPPETPVPAVRTADCVPLLLAAPSGPFAAVHAGWRGTVAGVVAAALDVLERAGAAPSRLVAAIGPAIGPCCYPVGPDVAEAVARAVRAATGVVERDGAGHRVDLREAVAVQLRQAGVPPGSIHTAPWCTSCRGDRFWSYRRDGGAAGRHMALVGPLVVSRA